MLVSCIVFEIYRDIGRKSRCFVLHAFDAPISEVSVIIYCRNIWCCKNQTGAAIGWWEKFEHMLSICWADSTEYWRVTDRQTDTSPPIAPTLITGSVYARRRRPCSMFLAPNTWSSVAVHSVQLQLVWGTVCQRQCSRLSHWTYFDVAWKLNCSSVLTTDTAPVKRLYCCVTHFHFPAAFCCGCNLEVYRL